MRKIYLILSMFILASNCLCLDASFNFVKTTVENGQTEVINGIMYLKDNGKDIKSTYFHVTNPVNQILTFTKNETIAYYPDEKKAVVIVSKDEVSNFTFFTPTTKKFDLAEMGFTRVASGNIPGGKTETWAPNNINMSPVKKLLIDRDTKGRLLKMEMTGKDGNVMNRMQYSDYSQMQGKQFPLKARTYTGQGKSGYEEEVVLSNIKEGNVLPPIIKDFKIPEGTDIKRIEMK